MMTPSLLPVQGAGQVPDTVYLAAPSEFLVTVQAISTIVLAAVVLLVLAALLLVLFQLRKLSRSVTGVVGRLERDSGPLVEKAKSVAENVDYISAAIRTDVEKVNDSVAQLNARLTQASERMEERIQDFNALVEVLQGEAEELALDTAAAWFGQQPAVWGMRMSPDAKKVSFLRSHPEGFPIAMVIDLSTGKGNLLLASDPKKQMDLVGCEWAKSQVSHSSMS